jgi:hypothetical protein
MRRAREKIPRLRSPIAKSEVFLSVLAEYLPIFLFLIVAGGIGVALLLTGWFLARARPTTARPRRTSALRGIRRRAPKFDVRYYLIAILFIIFDLEIAFCSRGQSYSSRSASSHWSRWACSCCCYFWICILLEEARWNGNDAH